jgi:hypothetical protein
VLCFETARLRLRRSVVNTRTTLAAGCLAVLAAVASACSPSSAGPNDASDEHGLTGMNPEAGAGDGGDGAAMGLTTTLRLAQLSRDVGGVDVCYRAYASQTFSGPIFASATVPIEAGTPDAGRPDGASGDAAIEAARPDAAQDATIDGAVADSTTSDAEAADATPSDATLADAGSDASIEDAAGDAADSAIAEAGAEAGSSSGLSYLEVSSYVSIPGAGTFEIVIVPGGQGSCTNAIVDRKVTLDDGKRATLALFGSAQAEAGAFNALDLIAMVDDPSIVTAGTRTRFFDSARNATDAAAPAQLLISVVGMPSQALAVVTPGAAPSPSASPPTADALGYHTDVPVAAPADLRIQADIDSDAGLDAGPPLWASSPVDLHLDPASLHTGFVVRDTMGQFAILWCDDTSFGSAASACTLLLR